MSEDTKCNISETTYKCKLCGAELQIKLPIHEPGYTGDDEIRYFIQHPDKALPLIHKCDDGSQGVLEFVGIKATSL